MIDSQPAAETTAPKAPGAAVQLHAVTKRYRQGDSVVEAIKNVSVQIEHGEYVAVMGPSGSGKSTMFHVMGGLTAPDAGQVLVDNVDLSHLNDRRLTEFRRQRIGLVFQAFNLIPTLTAEENVLLPALAAGADGDLDGRVTELLDRLGIARRRHHRPDSLSGGEQQRVAIARALVGRPAVVLADEPTGSLDSFNGQAICRLLRELCEEERRTILVITHEPAVAAWAERVLIMKDGQVLTEFATREFGDAQRLSAHYQEVLLAADSNPLTGGIERTP